ncbi:MAG: hypothetical protein IJU20_07380 [Clostridia bacterium]|nr:hypothetical protein [Clostridia bacterium]
MKETELKNLKKRQISQLVIVVIVGLAVLGALVIFFNRSLGWIVENRNVNGLDNTSMQVDGDFMPQMHAWRFDMDATIESGALEDEDGDTFSKTGVWVDALDSSSVTDSNAILPIVIRSGGGEKYTFRSLHLGTVDNLLTLSNDNCFYIRFDVTERPLRSAIRYELSSSAVRIYSQDGVDRTQEIQQTDSDAIALFADLLVVEAGVSTEEYEPSEKLNEMDALVSSDGLLVNGGDWKELKGLEQGYYVYIRFYPDLSKCFDATTHIVKYMPCEIVFDLELLVSFETTEGSGS